MLQKLGRMIDKARHLTERDNSDWIGIVAPVKLWPIVGKDEPRESLGSNSRMGLFRGGGRPAKGLKDCLLQAR